MMRNKISKIALIPLLVASLSACTSVKYIDQGLNEQLHYDENVANQYTADPEWWFVYNDPQLNALMYTAFENNIDLAKSAIAVNRALYQANLIGADLVPTFSAGLSAGVNKQIGDLTGSALATGTRTSHSYGGNVGLNYEIDLWRRLHDSASAQEWEYKATVEDKEAARLALINGVIDAYYHLAYLNDALVVGQQNIDRMKKMNDITATKYKFGAVSGLEVSQSKQSLLMAQNNLLDLQNQKKAAEQTLRNLLNLKPSDELMFVYPHLNEVALPKVDLNVPFAVLANRPDLKAVEYRLKSAFKKTKAVEKSWYPSITLGGSLNASSNEVNSMFDFPLAGGTISINLPFLQWNKVKWNVKISQAAYEAQKLTFEQTLTTALNEVDTYYEAFNTAKQTLANVEKKYQEDLKIANFYKVRYENGASELSDWLNALNTESSSRLNLLNSRYQVIKLANMVYKSMAGRYSQKVETTTETNVQPEKINDQLNVVQEKNS